MSTLHYTNAYANDLRRIVPDLIRARQLLFDLIWKDVRVKYRFAVMGLLWAILEPLFMMLVLTFVFSFVFRLRFGEAAGGEGIGFDAVFILTGLVAWQFFSGAVSTATRCLIDSENLVTKVNFPREVLPLAAVGTAFVNFAIGAVLLLLLFLVMVGMPAAAVAWIAPVFVIELILVIGLSLIVASFNVTYRDVSYMVNAGLLFGFYATPIFYEPQMVRDALEGMNAGWLYPLYHLNPMVGLITAYREALFLGTAPSVGNLAWPSVLSIALFVMGFVVFRMRAATLADQL
jgi:ABC-type polysaccharide/polyol phosphate export permease